MIAGIDGCREGWIAAIEESGTTRLQVLASLTGLFEDPALVAAVIDVPIGLPDVGPRSCDLLARQLLRAPRASSVFPAPIRSMLLAGDQSEASRIRFDAEGKRCSVQLAAILPKIREVDHLLSPERQRAVREGHPEVSFAIINAGRPMSHHKRGQAGQDERISLLGRHFSNLGTAPSEIGRLRLDAIDAYAMLWTARRLAAGTNRNFPASAIFDRRGLRMEIVA